MTFLTKEQLLAAGSDIPTEVVEVPGRGKIRLRGLTTRQRDAFEAAIGAFAGKVDPDNIRAKLVARCAVTEAGDRMFRDDEADIIGDMAAVMTEPLFAAAQRVSGMSNRDVEELAKNSGATHEGDSSSASRVTSGARSRN